MTLEGVKDLIRFLGLLRDEKIHFFLEQHSFDSVTVTFTIVGFRVEVYFYEDHVNFSYFKGDEGASSNQELLLAFAKGDYSVLEALGIADKK